MTNTNTFGTRLLQARLNRGAARGKALSQTEVGAVVGVTGASVSRWEAGKKEPSLATIVALAETLGVNACWLAFGRLDF